jgi:hypothetical protein
MKNLIALALVATLVACTSENSTTPAPVPAPEPTEEIDNGGPCGDGRELGPDEHCP